MEVKGLTQDLRTWRAAVVVVSAPPKQPDVVVLDTIHFKDHPAVHRRRCDRQHQGHDGQGEDDGSTDGREHCKVVANVTLLEESVKTTQSSQKSPVLSLLHGQRPFTEVGAADVCVQQDGGAWGGSCGASSRQRRREVRDRLDSRTPAAVALRDCHARSQGTAHV